MSTPMLREVGVRPAQRTAVDHRRVLLPRAVANRANGEQEPMGTAGSFVALVGRRLHHDLGLPPLVRPRQLRPVLLAHVIGFPSTQTRAGSLSPAYG